MPDAILPRGILDQTIAGVTDILGDNLGRVVVERAVLGLFFTGVKLSVGPDGVAIAGSCATPREAIAGDVCCPVPAQALPFPGQLKGRPAADLMPDALSEDGLPRALGIATLNGLAELCWRRRPHPGVDLLAGA